jgi:hypothetical protein
MDVIGLNSMVTIKKKKKIAQKKGVTINKQKFRCHFFFFGGGGGGKLNIFFFFQF